MIMRFFATARIVSVSTFAKAQIPEVFRCEYLVYVFVYLCYVK